MSSVSHAHALILDPFSFFIPVVFSGLGLMLLIGSLWLSVAKRALRLCFVGAAASANRLCRKIVSL